MHFLPVDMATALHFRQNVDHVARLIAERIAPAERPVDSLRRIELFDLWLQ